MPIMEIDLKISDESLDCIIEMAGFGINYWAVEAEQDEEAKTYKITESEEGDNAVHLLTYDKITEAFWAIANPGNKAGSQMCKGYALHAVMDGVKNGEGDIDAGHVDSDLADEIMQVAIFGEVIYG